MLMVSESANTKIPRTILGIKSIFERLQHLSAIRSFSSSRIVRLFDCFKKLAVSADQSAKVITKEEYAHLDKHLDEYRSTFVLANACK